MAYGQPLVSRTGFFLEGVAETEKEINDVCMFGEPPKLRFPRLGRHPELVNRLSSQGHMICFNGHFYFADTESALPLLKRAKPLVGQYR